VQTLLEVTKRFRTPALTTPIRSSWALVPRWWNLCTPSTHQLYCICVISYSLSWRLCACNLIMVKIGLAHTCWRSPTSHTEIKMTMKCYFAICIVFNDAVSSSDYIGTKMTAFWNTAPCSLVQVDRRFRGAYCLHHRSVSTWNLSACRRLLHGASSQKAAMSPSYSPPSGLQISVCGTEW
jgi:hypothetical protein